MVVARLMTEADVMASTRGDAGFQLSSLPVVKTIIFSSSRASSIKLLDKRSGADFKADFSIRGTKISNVESVALSHHLQLPFLKILKQGP